MPMRIAIIGRPNVGKSTLFNRLVGKRLALVDDTPGVTRDLREGDARLFDLRFTVIDTAGLEEANDASLQGRMRLLTERAVNEADLSLFVIDARAGITASDRNFAELLRKREAPVLVVANKAEGQAGDAGYYDAFSLGMGEAVRVSAEHGEGLEDLRAALLPLIEAHEDLSEEPETGVVVDDTATEGEDAAAAPVRDPLKPVQIAIMGRPNAGKSTLVNRILGDDKMLTGPEAGITRDSIGTVTDWGGQRVKLFDTAGMRRKARITEKLEKMSVGDGLRAIRFAEVVIVLLDAQNPLETQDLRLADLAEREGRAVVIAINKWDLVEEKQRDLAALKEAVGRLLPQLRGVPFVVLSALDGKGIDRLRKAVMDAHDVWNMRISTSRLNRWLLAAVSRHPPPAPGGRRIRIRYMTQVKTRPPSFVIFVSKPEDLPDAYIRYLANGMRDDFGLLGTPLRLMLRKGDNPYKPGKPRR